MMQFQVNRARETYREAMLLLPAADKKSQKSRPDYGGYLLCVVE